MLAPASKIPQHRARLFLQSFCTPDLQLDEVLTGMGCQLFWNVCCLATAPSGMSCCSCHCPDLALALQTD